MYKRTTSRQEILPLASGGGLLTSFWSDDALTLRCTSNAASLPMASLSTLIGLWAGLGSTLGCCRGGGVAKLLLQGTHNRTHCTSYYNELTGLDGIFTANQNAPSAQRKANR